MKIKKVKSQDGKEIKIVSDTSKKMLRLITSGKASFPVPFDNKKEENKDEIK